MKKVLIVSPHFPPINAPDMQRVRLALPFLRAHGWEPTVLAVAPEHVEGGVRDPRLETSYPADIRVIRVRGLPVAATRWAGFGGLWRRCGRAIRREGGRLLANEPFDLVFFSTTQFSAFALGPRWLRQFGVPFVVDYQDPWINDHYRKTGTRPPGGALKYAVGQWSARRAEPRVVRDAAAVVSVSAAYTATLAERYADFDPTRAHVLPFGASAADFAALGDYRPAKLLIDFDDGFMHCVYAGRGGDDMAPALTILFRAFKRHLATNRAAAEKLRFDFVGTDYAPPPLGREHVLPVARAEGVEAFVREHCYRVPYFDALFYLRNASALVVTGSNDPGYAASKLFPYVLARRPLLLIAREDSALLGFARQIRAGVQVAFDAAAAPETAAEEVRQRWFANGASERYLPHDDAAFAPFTAAHLTQQLAAVFDEAARRRPAR
jgi:hypothetical protein